MARSINRSCNKLREKSDKKREIQESPGRLHLFIINVDRISHGLKSVKRYADRKDYSQKNRVQFETENARETLEIYRKKVKVFEKPQDQEIAEHTDK